MRGINRLVLGFAAVICVAIFFLAKSLLTDEVEPASYQVSVIVNESSSSRWSSFQAGIKQAADEKKVRLNYVTTDLAGSSIKQSELVEKEIANGADGLILQLYKSGDAEKIADMAAGKAEVDFVDCDLKNPDTDGIDAGRLGIDNEAVAKSLMEAIKKDKGGSVKGDRYLILEGNLRMDSMVSRRDYFSDELEESGGEICMRIEKNNFLADNISNAVKEGDFDAIVAMDDQSLSTAAEILARNGSDIKLYGVGCSDKNLYYLDKGTIDAMMVPNEYYMGYISMMDLLDRMGKFGKNPRDQEVDFVYATGENMYDVDIQRILFPIVQ